MTRLRIPRLLAQLVVAAISGLITNFAFPEPGWWPLAFAGVGGLFLTLGRGLWRNAAMASVFGMAFFLPQLDWANFVVGPMPWVALSISQTLYFVVACSLWSIVARTSWFEKRPIITAISFATIWTALDAVRSSWPWGGFPWSRLAFSQSNSPVGRLAWVGGATFVTWVTVLIAVLCAVAIYRLIQNRVVIPAGGERLRSKYGLGRFPFGLVQWRASALLGATAIALVLGGFLVPLPTSAERGEIKVGAVQGNVPGEGLDAFSEQRVVLHNHANQTQDLADRETAFDLVVWPENASDIDPDKDAEAAAEIDKASRAVDAPILLGTIRSLPENSRLNLSVMWVPGVGITDTYAKQRPVPFAEYIPWRDFFRTFTDLVDLVHRDMAPGTEPGVVEFESVRLKRSVTLGVGICFEVATDPVFQESVAEGAELLIVQTNNANFGPTNESVQQLAMSRLRAMEYGRAVVHVSTVGVSGIFGPDGTQISRSGHFMPDDLTATLPLRNHRTPASYVGKFTPAIAYAGSLLIIFYALMLNRTARKREQ